MPQPNQYRAEDTYYSFLQRISQSVVANAIPSPIGFNTVTVPQGLDFPIAVDQAIKLVSIDVHLTEGVTPGTPICNSLLVRVLGSGVSGPSTIARFYAPIWSRVPIGAGAGVTLHVEDPEWLFWNDYAEQGNGGLPPSLTIQVSADIDSTVIPSLNFEVQIVAELYEKQKLGLSGQKATLRTLQEIE